MKTLLKLLIPTLVLMLASCGGRKDYQILGTCSPDLNGQQAYLYDFYNDVVVDSTVITDGKFEFKGEAEIPFIAFCDVSYDQAMPVMVEPGKIIVDFVNLKLGGTPLNEDYAKVEFDPQVVALQRQLDSLARLYYQETDTLKVLEIDRQGAALYDKVNALRSKRVKEVYKDHTNDILGVWLLFNMTSGDQAMDSENFDKMLASAGEYVRDHPIIREIKQQLEGSASVNNGQFVDIKGTEYSTGKTAMLSQMIKGHLALVDFWASWCKPCCQEISENLIDIYNRYKGQGLVVVGVDINDDKAKHDAMTKQLGINYPQLIDEKNQAVDAYHIEGIPYIMLVDKDGNIIATDLRGDEIEKAVKNALSPAAVAQK